MIESGYLPFLQVDSSAYKILAVIGAVLLITVVGIIIILIPIYIISGFYVIITQYFKDTDGTQLSKYTNKNSPKNINQSQETVEDYSIAAGSRNSSIASSILPPIQLSNRNAAILSIITTLFLLFMKQEWLPYADKIKNVIGIMNNGLLSQVINLSIIIAPSILIHHYLTSDEIHDSRLDEEKEPTANAGSAIPIDRSIKADEANVKTKLNNDISTYASVSVNCHWKRDSIQPFSGKTRWKCSKCRTDILLDGHYKPQICKKIHQRDYKL